MTEPLSDKAVYLGDGVWWQVSERFARVTTLPVRFRPLPEKRGSQP